MKKYLFNRTTLFILFALAAVALMGSTFTKSTGSDLHVAAKYLTGESSCHVRQSPMPIAYTHPGAILRANVIK